MDIRKALEALKNNDGLTLKDGKPVIYKTGWQVATEGIMCVTITEAIKAIESYENTCGIWYSNKIYYIDKSKRVNTKKEALMIGRSCHQISVLRWRDMGLVYC